MTLADGLPVWEGAAVLFGSGKPRGCHYVHGIEAGTVALGHDHFADPKALVLDISHRPTVLALAEMIAHRKGWTLDIYLGRLKFEEPGGDAAPWRGFSFDDGARLTALWLEVSRG